jgi:hypothetical protein
VVVGDTVNTASRLESFDKELFAPDADTRPARILIGEPTLVRLDARFETERVGEVSLKGKENRISIHRVIGSRQQPALTKEHRIGVQVIASKQESGTMTEVSSADGVSEVDRGSPVDAALRR